MSFSPKTHLLARLLLLVSSTPFAVHAAEVPAVVAGTPEEGVQEPRMSKELQGLYDAAKQAADAVKKRESALMATNETVKAVVACRDKLIADREQLILEQPEVKELSEAIPKTQMELQKRMSSPDAQSAVAQEELKALRLQLANQRKKLRLCKLGENLSDPRIASLQQKAIEANQDILKALAKDSAYASLAHQRNLAMAKYQSVTVPHPEIPGDVVKAGLEDAKGKPVETLPVDPSKTPKPLPSIPSPNPPTPLQP